MAPVFFGIKAKIVVLIPFGKKPFSKKDWIEMMNSFPITGQADLKHSTVYPSGPGDLSFRIANSTLVISSAVIAFSSISFTVSEQRQGSNSRSLSISMLSKSCGLCCKNSRK
ncbi:hypothetical protein YC2023_117015 [Brassica napus]